MRIWRGVLRSLRWSVSIVALLVTGASVLSFFYHFGAIKTVPYPGGTYAPIHTTMVMIDGGFLYEVGQGMTDVGPTSPYVVIGTHWRWARTHRGYSGLWWRARLDASSIEAPPWLVVGPPVLATLALWMPSLLRRVSRRPHQCGECGYDRRGLAADTKCPECGARPAK